jgi:hypothetical protein
MEGHSIELEILCDGEQPLNEQGDPSYNKILLYDKCEEFILEKIKSRALALLHYGVHRAIPCNITPDNCITGNVWATDANGKKSLLGRYIRRSARFVWEQSV